MLVEAGYPPAVEKLAYWHGREAALLAFFDGSSWSDLARTVTDMLLQQLRWLRRSLTPCSSVDRGPRSDMEDALLLVDSVFCTLAAIGGLSQRTWGKASLLLKR